MNKRLLLRNIEIKLFGPLFVMINLSTFTTIALLLNFTFAHISAAQNQLDNHQKNSKTASKTNNYLLLDNSCSKNVSDTISWIIMGAPIKQTKPTLALEDNTKSIKKIPDKSSKNNKKGNSGKPANKLNTSHPLY